MRTSLFLVAILSAFYLACGGEKPPDPNAPTGGGASMGDASAPSAPSTPSTPGMPK